MRLFSTTRRVVNEASPEALLAAERLKTAKLEKRLKDSEVYNGILTRYYEARAIQQMESVKTFYESRRAIDADEFEYRLNAHVDIIRREIGELQRINAEMMSKETELESRLAESERRREEARDTRSEHLMGLIDERDRLKRMVDKFTPTPEDAGNVETLIAKLEAVLQDPITLERVKNPVILPGGQTVGKEVIDKMREHGNYKDPFTRVYMGRNNLVPNLLARDVLDVIIMFKE